MGGIRRAASEKRDVWSSIGCLPDMSALAHASFGLSLVIAIHCQFLSPSCANSLFRCKKPVRPLTSASCRLEGNNSPVALLHFSLPRYKMPSQRLAAFKGAVGPLTMR